MEIDFSHLNAIQDRIHRETMRFMSARNEKERQFRFSQVEQAKREEAAEYRFLGIEPSQIDSIDDISDDELLEILKGE
jgi:hypothetical protein